MPKQKTHKGTKKRFRLTASGKVKHRQAGTSHRAGADERLKQSFECHDRVLSKRSANGVAPAFGIRVNREDGKRPE